MSASDFSEVDLDLLADYLGGVLTGTPDEERVAARIADDPAWRAAHDDLSGAMTSVSAALRTLDPEPMPADLAARLDAVLRGPADTVVPITAVGERRPGRAAAGRSRSWPRWAAPIAVAAGLITCAGFGLTQFSQQADDAGSTAENAAALPAAGDGSMVQPPAVEQILTTGTDYTRSTLAQRLPRTAAQMPAAPAPDTAGSVEPLSEQPEAAALLACLDAIARENAGGTIAVQSVDYASFEGTPALVVEFTAANGGWSWASGRDCGTPGTGAATLARVPVR